MPPLIGLVVGGGIGAIAGGALGVEATLGQILTSTAIGASVGGAAGMFVDASKKPKLPEIGADISTPTISIEEIEAQEAGWEQIMKRARGRRGTILTEPQLAGVQPYTRKATLLGG